MKLFSPVAGALHLRRRLITCFTGSCCWAGAPSRTRSARRVDPSSSPPSNWTLLRLFKPFFDFKGDLKYCGGSNGETPLLWAASQGSLSCLKLLLKVANTAATDLTGKGLLSVAIFYHRIVVVETLLQRPKVDVLLCDEQGVSPLGNAVREGQHHGIEILLKSPKVEASIHDGANEGILHEAVERDHLEVVKVLLCCESVTRNPYYRLRDGFSPLRCAVRGNEYLPTIPLRSLFKDVSCPSYSGMPSRMILKVPLESGLSDVNAAGGDGMTALHHACMLTSNESTAFEGIVRGTMGYDRYGGARGDILLDICSAPGINLDLVQGSTCW